MNRTFFLAGLIGTLLISACKKDERTITQFDSDNIQDYIKANNLQMTRYGNTDIYYQVVKAGTGPTIDYSKELPVVFTEKSLDGRYASVDTFNTKKFADRFGYFRPDSLRSVIYNQLKNEGGEIRILIPSRLAFGTEGGGGVPGNASLDYTVKMLNASAIPAYDDAVIQKYMQANSLTGFTKTSSGLYYKIASVGTGTDAIRLSSIVTTEHTRKLFNSIIFNQATTALPASELLSNKIKGEQEGIPLIKSGGSIRLLIPSKLAYGTPPFRNQQTGELLLPGFSCLDYDIKVTAVTN